MLIGDQTLVKNQMLVKDQPPDNWKKLILVLILTIDIAKHFDIPTRKAPATS